jgi:hypothetical protein
LLGGKLLVEMNVRGWSRFGIESADVELKDLNEKETERKEYQLILPML